MKYLRKIVVLILSVIFLASIVVGMCVIYAVKNVNVEFVKYSEEYLDEYETAKENLSKVKGTSLLFLSEEDVKSYVSSDHIVLLSFEKVYPCTVDVVIKERVETFAVKTADGYDIYDAEGAFIKNAASNLNPIDGCPNVTLNIASDKIAAAVETCNYFDKYFSVLRGSVESVEIKDAAFGVDSTMTFRLFSGLSVVVIDYEVYPEEKIAASYNEFLKLTERQKVRGSILASAPDGDLGAVGAAYIG